MTDRAEAADALAALSRAFRSTISSPTGTSQTASRTDYRQQNQSDVRA